MCCTPNRKAKREFLESFGNRKTKAVWKVVEIKKGILKGPHVAVAYHSGVNVATTWRGEVWRGRYDTVSPSGFHVWATAYDAVSHQVMYQSIGRRAVKEARIAKLLIHHDDVVVVGANGEVVVRKFTFPKKEYDRVRRAK